MSSKPPEMREMILGDETRGDLRRIADAGARVAQAFGETTSAEELLQGHREIEAERKKIREERARHFRLLSRLAL